MQTHIKVSLNIDIGELCVILSMLFLLVRRQFQVRALHPPFFRETLSGSGT